MTARRSARHTADSPPARGQYGAPGRIRLCLCGCELLLEGEELTILSLNAHMTEIRGHIFRLSFLEGPT